MKKTAEDKAIVTDLGQPGIVSIDVGKENVITFDVPSLSPEMTKSIVITRAPIGGDKPAPAPKKEPKPKKKNLTEEERFNRIVSYIDSQTQAYRVSTRRREPKTARGKAKLAGQILAEIRFDDNAKRLMADLFTLAIGAKVNVPGLRNANQDDEDSPEGNERRETDVKKCMCVVPIGNPNGHDYPIGEPCVVIVDDDAYPRVRCVKKNKDIGNTLLCDKRYTRAATREEIITWMKAVGGEKYFTNRFNVIII